MAIDQAEAVSRDGVPDRRYFRTPATAPGPSGPQMLARLREIRSDPLGFLQRMTQVYGPVVQFPIPSPASYLVADPAAVRRVLVDRSRAYDKATVQYRSLSLVTGEGLLTTSGDIWRRQRRMVQPAFHRASLEAVVGHAAAATEELLVRWGDTSRGAVIDIDEAMMRVALETVAASLFGTDLSSDADRLARATLEALDVVVSSAQIPVRLPAWTPSQRSLRRATRELDEAVHRMVQRRLAETAPRADLLGLLVAALDGEDPIPLREVRDELVSFMVAGHETAASALTWALWLLAGDPVSQQHAIVEVDEVLGGRSIRGDDLPNLAYLRAVIDEAMRLYPPVWLVTRRAMEPDVLGGREIPADSLVIMTPYLAQRDPRMWPEPERFDPERFLGEQRGGAADDAAYWPFGLGPRMCVGKDFAYLESISVLASLLQHVRVERVPGEPDPRAVPLVTLRPAGALPLIVRPR
ncbi:MAG: cytochrome P450 [Actinobacteria bacterium]|nr:cytochrome P450 [Actinomycetota bacterium]